MKKNILLLALVLMGFVATIQAQTKIKVKDLIGTWMVDGEVNTSLVFNKDGSLIANEGKRTNKGSWIYDAAKQQLKLFTAGHSDTLFLDIISLNAARMEAKRLDESSGKISIFTKTKSSTAAAKPLKKLSDKKVASAIIGEWEAYVMNIIGVLPAEQRSAMGVTILKNGEAELNEMGAKQKGKWSISEDHKTFTLQEENSGSGDSFPFAMYGKDILVFYVNENMTIVWRRKGSPEPQDAKPILSLLGNAQSMIGNNNNNNNGTKPEPSPSENYKKIMGTWQIVKIGMEETKSEALYITFNEDGSVITETATESPKKGKWKMSPEGTYIQIAEDYGYDYYGGAIYITELSGDKMLMSDNDQPMELIRKK